MILADWIAIILVLGFAVLGYFIGFGGGLKFFTHGIFGIIISIVVCYFFLGVVLSWGFVQDLSARINESIAGDGTSNMRVWLAENSFVNKAIVAVIVFFVVQILRIVIVNLLKSVLEAPNLVCKIINKTLGVILFICTFIFLALLIAHVISWVGGSTVDTITEYLSGSALWLDKLFLNNPLTYIIN